MKKLVMTVVESEEQDGNVSINVEFDPPLSEDPEYSATPVAAFCDQFMSALGAVMREAGGKVEKVSHG
jgi:hypothetical protein